ncbi:PEF-CTERM sorting domain-containing protein [Methanosarcina hadiensis]|uniref:PEF-CTERM sorting domain-containing protein n=1 Tax=Methanosarcina hadiensis TaxID=3078083 RepID=UPI0039773D84
MRFKFIIGILICLISLTGTALAYDYYAVLDTPSDDAPGAQYIQYVTASVSGDVATFTTKGIGSYPTGWFDVVGLPEGVSVVSVQDKDGNILIRGDDYTVSTSANIDGFQYPGTHTKIIFSVADFTSSTSSPEEKARLSQVKVKFSGEFTYPEALAFGAHVAWGDKIALSDGKLADSAKYLGYGSITEVPEFPTIAAPVAAILGLMFIFGRKKQE